MRVLFVSWGWASHYYPLVPLAWACRAAGHEVRMASQPALVEAMVTSGLPAVSVGEDVDFKALFARTMGPLIKIPDGEEARAERQRRLRTAPFEMFCEVASAMGEDLVGLARHWRPDVVVYEPTSYAALLAASAVDVPAVRHVWSADYSYFGKDGESEVLPKLFSRFGVPEIDTLGALTLDACPPSMQIESDYPRRVVRYVPYNGTGTEPAWLREPRRARRICLTWGTTVSHVGDGLFALPELVDAVSSIPGTELVVAITPAQRELLGETPPGVRVAEGLPLNLLLPSCDVQIQQGGAGTTMTALACGVPQLVVPQIPDQLFNARHLAKTGAGGFIPRKDATPEDLRRLVQELLDEPGYAQAAARMAQEIREQPAPARAVEALEDLARGDGSADAGGAAGRKVDR